MLFVNKCVFLATIFFSFSMPVCAMESEDVDKVLAMNKPGQIEKFLDTKTNADAIALKVLVALRQNEWVARKVVDTLIRYASPTDIEREVSAHPGYEGSYATIKMRAKAREVSQTKRTLSELSDGELLEAWHDHATVSQTMLDYNSNESETGGDTGINSDDDSAPLFNQTDALLHQAGGTRRLRSDRKIVRSARREGRKKKYEEIREKHTLRQKNQASLFSYVGWTGLCVGIAGLVYYLYAHRDHKATAGSL